MSDSVEMIITSRERDIGGFTVRRILPYASHRMVGPFTFFDHMGPAEFKPGEGMDVRPHPHINLATVTYLFERTPDEKRKTGMRVNGIQLWVALPVEHEETDPSFTHYPKNVLPEFTHQNSFVKLLVGNLFGKSSPVKIQSSCSSAEVQLENEIFFGISSRAPSRGSKSVSANGKMDQAIAQDSEQFLATIKSTFRFPRPLR